MLLAKVARIALERDELHVRALLPARLRVALSQERSAARLRLLDVRRDGARRARRGLGPERGAAARDGSPRLRELARAAERALQLRHRVSNLAHLEREARDLIGVLRHRRRRRVRRDGARLRLRRRARRARRGLDAALGVAHGALRLGDLGRVERGVARGVRRELAEFRDSPPQLDGPRLGVAAVLREVLPVLRDLAFEPGRVLEAVQAHGALVRVPPVRGERAVHLIQVVRHRQRLLRLLQRLLRLLRRVLVPGEARPVAARRRRRRQQIALRVRRARRPRRLRPRLIARGLRGVQRGGRGVALGGGARRGAARGFRRRRAIRQGFREPRLELRGGGRRRLAAEHPPEPLELRVQERPQPLLLLEQLLALEPHLRRVLPRGRRSVLLRAQPRESAVDGVRLLGHLVQLGDGRRRGARGAPLLEQALRLRAPPPEVLDRLVRHGVRGHLLRDVVRSGALRVAALGAEARGFLRGGEFAIRRLRLGALGVVLLSVLRLERVRGGAELVEPREGARFERVRRGEGFGFGLGVVFRLSLIHI